VYAGRVRRFGYRAIRFSRMFTPMTYGAWGVVIGGVVGLGCGSVSSRATPDGGVDATTVDAGARVDGPVARCAPTPANLVARWRADAMAPTDDTGSFLGTPLGSPGYAPGKHGSAFALDGAHDGFTVQDHEVLWPAASFSVEAWVLTTNPGAAQTVIRKYDSHNELTPNTGQGYWQLELENGHAQFSVRSDGGTTASIADQQTSGFAANVWHHVAGVRDSGAHLVLLYLDGALVNMAPDPGKLSNVDGFDDPLTIGMAANFARETPPYVRFFAGMIDEVAYYTSALSGAEIAAIHDAADGECP
jgi:concanavalin A-like lectin/glucanase superfamily protein